MNTKLSEKPKIAVIGIGLRVPGAENLTGFWYNLKTGKNVITRYEEKELLDAGIPWATLQSENYIRCKGVLKNVKGFDAGFFGYSPRESSLIDPQQRVFLECAWEAMEDAGYDSLTYNGNIGVYAGSGINRYLLNRNIADADRVAEKMQVDIGNGGDYLASRVAYKLNLTGPAVAIQTACSTSLVAIHFACQGLLAGDCDMALAGGVSLGDLEKSGYWYQPGLIYSSDGICRPFDAKANGIIRGQGAGILLLKPYEQAIRDGDHIYSRILATAINNDGSDKMGFTAPSAEGQSRVIRSALRKAEISAETIGYVEAHGTGTLLGDPIEMEGLTKAFRQYTDKVQFCALGSVKSNLGHLDAAAGVVGCIKAILCLYNQTLVPTLNFEQPNPYINFVDSPFYVNAETIHWEQPTLPRRAGVSALGLGGTNAHIILEEEPVHAPMPLNNQSPFLMTLSARSPGALRSYASLLSDFFQQKLPYRLLDIAFTLQVGRRPFPFRWAFICKTPEDAIAALQLVPNESDRRLAVDSPPVIFMFQGHGVAYPSGSMTLYEELPEFRKAVDDCIEILQEKFPARYGQLTIHELFIVKAGKEEAMPQPALFVMEYAMARYLISLGITPTALIGLSQGEYIAACLAGVFSLSDALFLVTVRYDLLKSAGDGKMLATRLSENELLAIIKENQLPLDIATITGSSSSVASGTPEAIRRLETLLEQAGIQKYELPSGIGYHSRVIDPVLDRLRSFLSALALHPPELPIISNVTGTWMTNEQAVSPDYWISHTRKTVRFFQGMSTMFRDENLQDAVFLEVSPGQTLCTLAKSYADLKDTQQLLFVMGRNSDREDNPLPDLYLMVGEVWRSGIAIQWKNFQHDSFPHRLPLPTYPFERQTYDIAVDRSQVIEAPPAFPEPVSPSLPQAGKTGKLPDQPSDQLYTVIAEIWQSALGLKEISSEGLDFFKIGGDSLLASKVLFDLTRKLDVSFNSGDLLRYPTLNLLTNYIRTKLRNRQPVTDSRDTHLRSIVQEFNAGDRNGNIPLILIHPVGGELYIYRDLISTLPKTQPVYGIHSPLLTNQTFSLTTIEKTASCYLDALSEAGISHPLILYGSSFGGVVAFEMAHLLTIEKKLTPLVVMVDSPPVPYTGVSSGSAKDGKDEVNTVIRVENANRRMLKDYMARPYPGNVLFFYPKEILPAYPSSPSFWQKMTEGRFQAYPIGGNHITMNYLPDFHMISARLEHEMTEINHL